jgi:hypothetical protein
MNEQSKKTEQSEKTEQQAFFSRASPALKIATVHKRVASL